MVLQTKTPLHFLLRNWQTNVSNNTDSAGISLNAKTHQHVSDILNLGATNVTLLSFDFKSSLVERITNRFELL